MPTGIGNGIAGDVFQNNLGAGGGGGGVICPSQYSLLFNGTDQVTFLIAAQSYNLGATNSSLSVWINTSDRNGVSGTGQGVYTSSNSSSGALSVYFDAGGDLKSTLGTMTFPSFPELVTNGDFSATGTELAVALTSWTPYTSGSSTVTYTGSVAELNIDSSNSLVGIYTPTTIIEYNKSYKIVVRMKGSAAFTASIAANAGAGQRIEIATPSLTTSYQTFTFYFTQNIDTNFNYNFAIKRLGSASGASQTIFIESASVKELGEGWDVQQPPGQTVSFNGTQAYIKYDSTATQGSTGINQSALESGKTYRFVLDIDSLTGDSGNKLRLQAGGATIDFATAGIKTFSLTTLNNGPLFIVRASNTTSFEASINSISVSEFISEDEWHHLALSIDRSGDWKWYIDGALTNTLANGNSDVPTLLGIPGFTLSNNFFVGNFDYTNGYMTEPSLWNVALSASEVKSIYDNMYGGQRCLGSLPFTSDLITNGNFAQIGSELVTNGNFSATGTELNTLPSPNEAADSHYRFEPYSPSTVVYAGSNVTEINANTITSGQGAYHYFRNTFNLNGGTLVVGKSYKVDISIKVNSGNFDIIFSSGMGNVFIPNLNNTTYTTITTYVVCLNVSTGYVKIEGLTSGQVVSINDVSIKELGEGWIEADPGVMSFNADGLKITAANYGSAADNRVYQSSVTEDDKSYKYAITIDSITAGCTVSIFDGANYINPQSTTGTFYFTRRGTNDAFYIALFNLSSASDFVQISSVTVQEVGQNWAAGFSGSGDVTFPNGTARIVTGANPNSAFIRQFSVMEIGKSYTMTYSIVSNNGGTLFNSGQTPSTMDSTVGSHSETFIAGSENILISRVSDNTDISITNVTLTQVGGGNLERWWRMNGTDASTYITANQAPNGTVNSFTQINKPQIVQEVP